MSDFKIEINRGAIGQLLKSGEVMSTVKQQAQMIANNAPHCEVDEAVLNTRVRAGIIQHMTNDDMENHTLLRAVKFI